MKKSHKINIYDLYRNIDEVKQKKNTSYNEVLILIHGRIKKASLKERYKIIYEVPEYLFGIPSYNLNKCLAYIMKELRGNGFLVKYYFPKILYISWDPVEITNYKKDRKLYEKKFKNLNKDLIKISKSEPNHNSDLSNFEEDNTNNIDNFFEGQSSLVGPSNTQHATSIFKPILNYDPNTIPTYNYYAYSTLNNNLVNDNFYISNGNNGNGNNGNGNNGNGNNGNGNNGNSYDADKQYLKTPQHLQNVQQLKDKRQRELDNNISYQKDIMDYYKDNDDDNPHPFKNSIKKHNSNGKFVLDLS